MSDDNTKYIFIIINGNSMKPIYPPLTKLVMLHDERKFVIGDVVVFHKSYIIVIHRVVDIIDDRFIITKGDNNIYFDRPLRIKNVIGKIVDKYSINNYNISHYSRLVGLINDKFGKEHMLTEFIFYIFQKYLKGSLMAFKDETQ